MTRTTGNRSQNIILVTGGLYVKASIGMNASLFQKDKDQTGLSADPTLLLKEAVIGGTPNTANIAKNTRHQTAGTTTVMKSVIIVTMIANMVQLLTGICGRTEVIVVVLQATDPNTSSDPKQRLGSM